MVLRCYVNFGVSVGHFPDLFSIVVDVVTRPVTTGLRQCNPGWHSIVSSPAAPVGHEFSGETRVLFVELRPHPSAPPPTALTESTGADSVQACCSCVQVFAQDSIVVSRR